MPVSVAVTALVELLELDELLLELGLEEVLLLEDGDDEEDGEPVEPLLDEVEPEVLVVDEEVLLALGRLVAVVGWYSSTPAVPTTVAPRTRGARRMVIEVLS